jgi:hypothetical protein
MRVGAVRPQGGECALGLLCVPPGQHDPRAGPSKTFRHAEADAAIAAGDERDAILK